MEIRPAVGGRDPAEGAGDLGVDHPGERRLGPDGERSLDLAAALRVLAFHVQHVRSRCRGPAPLVVAAVGYKMDAHPCACIGPRTVRDMPGL